MIDSEVTPLALHRKLLRLVAEGRHPPTPLEAIQWALGEARAAIETLVLSPTDIAIVGVHMDEAMKVAVSAEETATGLAALISHAMDRPYVFEMSVRSTLRKLWEHLYDQRVLRRAPPNTDKLAQAFNELKAYMSAIIVVPEVPAPSEESKTPPQKKLPKLKPWAMEAWQASQVERLVRRLQRIWRENMGASTAKLLSRGSPNKSNSPRSMLKQAD